MSSFAKKLVVVALAFGISRAAIAAPSCDEVAALLLGGESVRLTDAPESVEEAIVTLPSGHLPNEFLPFDDSRLVDCRNQVKPVLMEQAKHGGVGAALMLGFLKERDALPILRAQLLSDRYFYRWEGFDYSQEDSFLADGQYPHHQARIAAIESITGLPVGAAVLLTKKEEDALVREARTAKPDLDDIPANTNAYCAKWLLMKLRISPPAKQTPDLPKPKK